MNDRLRNVNKKISKSTIQIQHLMSQLLPTSKPLPPPYKKQQIYHQINPQNIPYNQNKMNKKHSSNSAKNQLMQTNPSSKYQQTRDRFYSTNKQTPYQSQSYSQIKTYNKDRDKDRDRDKQRDIINQMKSRNQLTNKNQFSQSKVKFAIGSNLYPSSNVVLNYNKQFDRNILNIDHKHVMEHALNNSQLNHSSSPQQIFNYFYQFALYFKKPLIKKFKNCLYFGQSLDTLKYKTSKYTGFLYFYTNKIYYGYFQQQHKHGAGIQINLKNKIIYKGSFNKGHKIGKFTVYFDDMMYEGFLSKGKFHGLGKLETPISVYIGQFFDGMRHGQGEQYFYKSGLKLKGLFQMDRFCNNHHFNIQQKIKHKQIPKSPPPKSKNLPKLSNIFDFSFHDSSDDQNFGSSKNFNIRKQQKYSPTIKSLPKRNRKEDDDLMSASDDDPLPAPFRRLAYNK